MPRRDSRLDTSTCHNENLNDLWRSGEYVFGKQTLCYMGAFRRGHMHGKNSVGAAKGEGPCRLCEMHLVQFQEEFSLLFRLYPSLKLRSGGRCCIIFPILNLSVNVWLKISQLSPLSQNSEYGTEGLEYKIATMMAFIYSFQQQQPE